MNFNNELPNQTLKWSSSWNDPKSEYKTSLKTDAKRQTLTR